jgi:hypothetical protein
LSWISIAPFEATITLDSGGADIVWIPAGAVLQNVLLPPAPNFGDPDAGARPVEFDYEGKPHTATIDDFTVVGGCYPPEPAPPKPE